MQLNNTLNPKTGFETSLEGEQVWPPKSFKVQPYCIEDPIKFLVDKMTEEELNSGKVPIRYKINPDSTLCL
jgi:hypothetical protein